MEKTARTVLNGSRTGRQIFGGASVLEMCPHPLMASPVAHDESPEEWMNYEFTRETYRAEQLWFQNWEKTALGLPMPHKMHFWVKDRADVKALFQSAVDDEGCGAFIAAAMFGRSEC